MAALDANIARPRPAIEPHREIRRAARIAQHQPQVRGIDLLARTKSAGRGPPADRAPRPAGRTGSAPPISAPRLADRVERRARCRSGPKIHNEAPRAGAGHAPARCGFAGQASASPGPGARADVQGQAVVETDARCRAASWAPRADRRPRYMSMNSSPGGGISDQNDGTPAPIGSAARTMGRGPVVRGIKNAPRCPRKSSKVRGVCHRPKARGHRRERPRSRQRAGVGDGPPTAPLRSRPFRDGASTSLSCTQWAQKIVRKPRRAFGPLRVHTKVRGRPTPDIWTIARGRKAGSVTDRSITGAVTRMQDHVEMPRQRRADRSPPSSRRGLANGRMQAQPCDARGIPPAAGPREWPSSDGPARDRPNRPGPGHGAEIAGALHHSETRP